MKDEPNWCSCKYYDGVQTICEPHAEIERLKVALTLSQKHFNQQRDAADRLDDRCTELERENERLKAELNKYSEDEILCAKNAEIERLKGLLACDICTSPEDAKRINCACQGTGEMWRAFQYCREYIARLKAELQSWETVADYARGNGVEGSQPGDLQRWIEDRNAELARFNRPCARCGSITHANEADKLLDADYHCSTCWRQLKAKLAKAGEAMQDALEVGDIKFGTCALARDVGARLKAALETK